jgi:inorganic pyrophosphatase
MTYEVIIEIPAGSSEKFEINEVTGEFEVNFVFKDIGFPFNYGYFPNTLADDGDPVDVAVFADAPLKTGDKVLVQPFGVMKTKDRGQQDNKILAVKVGDQVAKKYKDITDLSEEQKAAFESFYSEVGRQKEKEIICEGFGSKAEAEAEIQNSIL